jgi:hypothetical protein
MKNALILIAGDWQGVRATAYVHHKYTDPYKDGFIDFETVMKDGYDCLVKMDKSCAIDLVIGCSPKYEDKTFVWVDIESPLKIFDIKKVKCNVEIEVTRYLNVFQWVVYGVRLCWYKLTGY